MSRANKRSVAEYLTAAKAMSVYAPSLKKYARRQTNLTQWEKSAIARKENILRYAYNLQPVSKKQAKDLKDVLFKFRTVIKKGPNKGKYVEHGGIRAIQLSNTGEKVRLNIVNKNLLVTTNGRTWVYWQLNQISDHNTFPSKQSLNEIDRAGQTAFLPAIREAFPVEKIVKLAERAFANPVVKMIGLWAAPGRVGEPCRSLKEFVHWIYKDYSTYAYVERWVNGIAVLIADVGETIPRDVWTNRPAEEIRHERVSRRKYLRKG